MFSIYTISRQYGSGGSSFAKLLSAKTGYPLVWREVINKAAREIGSPEVALAMIDELDLFNITPDETTHLAYIESVGKIMFEFAKKGKQIIVGRASHMVLSDFPDVFRIRIIAGKQTRIMNICNSKHVNPIAAAAQIEQSDLLRAMYLEKFYHVDWNNPSLYDLIINTDHISIEKAVVWVINFPE